MSEPIRINKEKIATADMEIIQLNQVIATDQVNCSNAIKNCLINSYQYSIDILQKEIKENVLPIRKNQGLIETNDNKLPSLFKRLKAFKDLEKHP